MPQKTGRRHLRPPRSHSSSPGPAFVATRGFVEDFVTVWGHRAYCHTCRHPIRPGEAIRWLEAGRPATIHHERCLAKAAMTPVPECVKRATLTS